MIKPTHKFCVTLAVTTATWALINIMPSIPMLMTATDHPGQVEGLILRGPGNKGQHQRECNDADHHPDGAYPAREVEGADKHRDHGHQVDRSQGGNDKIWNLNGF
jgi:hypothetical protein